MTRWSTLERVLDAVVAADMDLATERANSDSAAPHPDEAWDLGLRSFSRFMAGDFTGAVELGDAAVRAAGDPGALALARAARGLAAAGEQAPGPDTLTIALADIDTIPSGPTGDFVRYLLAEASLACARLDLAAEFVERGDVGTPFPHPFGVVMTIMRVRLLVFRGRIADAAQLLATIPPTANEILLLLVACTETFVRGNAAERAEVRALADRLEVATPVARDYLTRGCYLLTAFGLVAVGDVQRSARFALLAGGDSRLSAFTIVDRGLGLELLVAAAAIENDLDAAESWMIEAEPLLESPSANSTVERLTSRVALMRGDAESAVEWADRAVASARAQGRAVEAAEGEIVAARARIAASRAGDASARLEAMVESADESGHLSARRSAARELRAAGRRLRPIAGSEWAGLSERERDIALMIAEGLANREIAADLHLSEHTVRAHVSRVLAAFGAASRFAVAARIAELFPDPGLAPAAALTPRQAAVAERIAVGAGNAEIGGDLGLSVKTVEKHVGAIFRRWDVGSRVGIARIVRAQRAGG
ncbi:MAG: LuxR C-terminal-related transcriptional regulator [Pseudolysinimonas sp.]